MVDDAPRPEHSPGADPRDPAYERLLTLLELIECSALRILPGEYVITEPVMRRIRAALKARK